MIDRGRYAVLELRRFRRAMQDTTAAPDPDPGPGSPATHKCAVRGCGNPVSERRRFCWSHSRHPTATHATVINDGPDDVLICYGDATCRSKDLSTRIEGRTYCDAHVPLRGQALVDYMATGKMPS